MRATQPSPRSRSHRLIDFELGPERQIVQVVMPGRHPFVQGIPLDAFPLTVRLGRHLPFPAFLGFPIQFERRQVGDAHDGEADGFKAVVCFGGEEVVS